MCIALRRRMPGIGRRQPAYRRPPGRRRGESPRLGQRQPSSPSSNGAAPANVGGRRGSQTASPAGHTMITRRSRDRRDDEAGAHPAAGGVPALREPRCAACGRWRGRGSAARLLRRDGPPGPRAASRGGLPGLALRLAPLLARRPGRAAFPCGASGGARRDRGHVAVERHRRGSARRRQRRTPALRPPARGSRPPLLHRLPVPRTGVRAAPPRTRRRRPSGPRRHRRSAGSTRRLARR